jgi:alkaline phosphatase D
MKIGRPQGSWNILLEEQPDLHLTVGDTHYADTTNPTVQLEHHLTYRREKEFAKVLQQVPTYAIWDDHDFGPNNSDGTAKGKEFSLAGWKQAWPNPPSGTSDTPGAFFKFSRGDVDFFVVDGRYHRSPNGLPDDDKKRMLGDAQFAWLLNGLKIPRPSLRSLPPVVCFTTARWMDGAFLPFPATVFLMPSKNIRSRELCISVEICTCPWSGSIMSLTG